MEYGGEKKRERISVYFEKNIQVFVLICNLVVIKRTVEKNVCVCGGAREEGKKVI